MSTTTKRATGLALTLAALCVASCTDERTYPSTPPDVVGGARPAIVYRPFDYDPGVAYPLVVLLHGYATNAFVEDAFFGTSARVDTRGYLLVTPEGTLDPEGKQYWNAGACCAFGPSPPDDVAYLTGLVDEIQSAYHVDSRRIFVIGHSNGGAMAMKLACDAPSRFAAITSLAGIAPEHASECPASPSRVSVLDIHGDADDVVLYDGTTTTVGIPLAPYPSATEALHRFALRLDCDDVAPTIGAAFDLAEQIAGAETTPSRYTAGCAPGTSAELWTIAGGSHIPFFVADGTDRVLDWLFAHPR